MAMNEIRERVLRHIVKHNPVSQDCVKEEFGNRGISELRDLMIQNKVSYDINWMLTIDSRGYSEQEIISSEVQNAE